MKMFEQTFKNIDDILHKDAGCSSELDYVEQTSWVLFLKYLSDFEKDKQAEAELSGKTYTQIIDTKYHWEVWAAPKGKDGKLDHHKALSGDDLKDFVDHKLVPYLKKFKISAESPDTIQYKIGEIFNELKNKIQSGYNLREVINLIDQLHFRSHAEKHEMSHLYEDKIKNMGNAGRNGGEYYTPRALIKTIIKVVDPKIGDKIYDGASGSAGFLVEAFEYLKSKKLSTKDLRTLQKKTFYGKEKKALAYIIGTMNMILHGIEAPNIIHTNTLAENIDDIQEKDRYHVILANPPFGGKERVEVQQNFPIKTGETAFLFLQHFIKSLKAGGRAGIVIKNTFLSNADNASVSLRKLLLESCNLHTVLDLPGGTFTGAGVKTVVLFFDKGEPTKKVWFYHLNLDRNLGKTNALNEKDLADFVDLQKTKANTENSWSINIKDIDQNTYDLSPQNPNEKEEAALRQPKDILREMKTLNEESANTLNSILELNFGSDAKQSWVKSRLGDICEIITRGISPNYTSSDGICVLNQKCIRGHQINYDMARIHDNKSKPVKSEKMIQAGDVLVNSTGTGTLGRVAQVRENHPIATVDSHVTIVRPKKDIFCDGFFGWSMVFIEEEISKSGEGCGGQTELAKSKLKNDFTICYPRSIQDQKIIVQKLEFLSLETKKLEAIYKKKINDLEELKKSILQKAFSGELIKSEVLNEVEVGYD